MDTSLKVTGEYTFDVLDKHKNVRRSVKAVNSLSRNSLQMLLHSCNIWQKAAGSSGSYPNIDSYVPLSLYAFGDIRNYVQDNVPLTSPLYVGTLSAFVYPDVVRLTTTIPEGEDLTIASVCQAAPTTNAMVSGLQVVPASTSSKPLPMIDMDADGNDGVFTWYYSGLSHKYKNGVIFTNGYNIPGSQHANLVGLALYESDDRIYPLGVTIKTASTATQIGVQLQYYSSASPLTTSSSAELTIPMGGTAGVAARPPFLVGRADIGKVEVWCPRNDGAFARARIPMAEAAVGNISNAVCDVVIPDNPVPVGSIANTVAVCAYYDKVEGNYWFPVYMTTYPLNGATYTPPTRMMCFKEETPGTLTTQNDYRDLGYNSAIAYLNTSFVVRLSPNDDIMTVAKTPNNHFYVGRIQNVLSYKNLSAPVVKAADESIAVSYTLKITNS